MSLWEKWEREKMERMGIKVERKSDVDIRDTRPKADLRKQSLVVVLAVLTCFIAVYIVLVLDNMYSGRWSNFPLVRSLVGIMEKRMDEGRTFR